MIEKLIDLVIPYIKRDKDAKDLCIKILRDFKETLEHLRSINHLRPPTEDRRDLKKIKLLANNLYENLQNLLIAPPKIHDLITLTLTRIQQWEEYPNEPQNSTTSVAVDIGNYWGNVPDRKYKATKVDEMQNFLRLNLAKRFSSKFEKQLNWFIFLFLLVGFTTCFVGFLGIVFYFILLKSLNYTHIQWTCLSVGIIILSSFVQYVFLNLVKKYIPCKKQGGSNP